MICCHVQPIARLYFFTCQYCVTRLYTLLYTQNNYYVRHELQCRPTYRGVRGYGLTPARMAAPVMISPSKVSE